MSNKQINFKTKNLLYEFSQITQNFDKINIKETEPIINDYIFEGDLSIMIDDLVDLIFMKLNEGKDAIIIKQHIFKYLNNHKIILQGILSWLSNNQNNSNSNYLLGYINYHGVGTNSDKKKAIELYKKAAELENNVAQLDLINIYIHGKDNEINYNLAFKLSKKLAEKEIPSAIYNLGYCYFRGIGTIYDTKKAFELYQKAADLGNSNGMNNLGWCYYGGIVTKSDDQKAFELFQKAADLENLGGINGLACCYEKGVGTDINKQKSFELLKKAAELGSISAQCNLAKMYENGSGSLKDMNQAVSYWYQKSAEQGYKYAQIKVNQLLKK